MMKSLFCLLLLVIFYGATDAIAAKIVLKPATTATASPLHVSPDVGPAEQLVLSEVLPPAPAAGIGSTEPLLTSSNNHLSARPASATGKRYSFRDRLVLKYFRKHVKKLGMRDGEPVDPRRLKQGRLALILGAGAFVVAFIPFVQILSPLMAIAAIAVGVVSLQGNSNLPGILGICFGGAFLLLILLVVAIFVLTFSFW